jgi:hypothetical protein
MPMPDPNQYNTELSPAWDPASWTPMHPSSQNSMKEGHAMAGNTVSPSSPTVGKYFIYTREK